MSSKFSNQASNDQPPKANRSSGKQKAFDRIAAALRDEAGLKPEWLRAL